MNKIIRDKINLLSNLGVEVSIISKNKVKKILRNEIPTLEKNYNINSLKLFGSYVRNEQTENSDVDILVGFNKTINIIKYIQLENHLSDLLNIKVDLVMENSLKKRIKHLIINEAEIL